MYMKASAFWFSVCTSQEFKRCWVSVRSSYYKMRMAKQVQWFVY